MMQDKRNMNVWRNTLKWLKGKKVLKKDLVEISEDLKECYKEGFNSEERATHIFPCVIKNVEPLILEFKEPKKNSIYYTDEEIEKFGIEENGLKDLGTSGMDVIYGGKDEKDGWVDKLKEIGAINVQPLSDTLEPDDPNAPDLPHGLLKNKGVYIYNGKIRLKVNNKTLSSSKEKFTLKDKELYKDIEAFKNEYNESIWEYILEIEDFEWVDTDNSFESMVLKEWAKHKEKKDIYVFRGTIKAKYENQIYEIKDGKIEIWNKILFKDFKMAAEHFGEDPDQDWLKFAIDEKILNIEVILKALEKAKLNKLRENEEYKKEVIGILKEKTKELSEKTESPDLTVEWLIVMTLWEYIKTYAERKGISLRENEIYYEGPDKISIPLTQKAGIEFWEVEKLDLFIHGKDRIYSNFKKIENIGFDHNLKLKLDIRGWNEGELQDKIELQGKEYGLEIKNNGELMVKDKDGVEYTGKGYINGVEVEVERGRVKVKSPIKLRLSVRLKYNISAPFWDEMIKFLRGLLNIKHKKVVELINKNRLELEFIWGPPATGKTTYIAGKIIERLKNNGRILILTPTNKAADVVVERILDLDKNAKIYRFPYQLGNSIPNKNILEKGKKDSSILQHSVAISTTIHRFIYDKIVSQEIKGIEWDMVVLDEASMIDLPFMIYVLQKAKTKKFLISGDPQQLTPVGNTPDGGSVKGYSTENIYTIMDMEDHLLENLEGRKIRVEEMDEKRFEFYDLMGNDQKLGKILIKQHRSVEEIGKIYSKFMYKDKLSHARGPSNSQMSFSLMGENLRIGPITIVYFTVDDTFPYKNKIYKGSSSSSYHIVSSVLAVEIAKAIEQAYGDKDIGIISPYRMQVDIMRKLAMALDLKNTTVSTVHSFQGDEREVIIFVLNPPSKSPRGSSNFENRRLLNVAVSRARDHLIVLWPRKGEKEEIKYKNTKELFEILSAVGDMKDIEGIIKNIENNIEIYNHKEVNLYTSSYNHNPDEKRCKYIFYVSPNNGPVDIYCDRVETRDNN